MIWTLKWLIILTEFSQCLTLLFKHHAVDLSRQQFHGSI